MAAICTAVGLYDDKPCTSEATNSNGLFCHVHAKQVQNLYSGYKKRGAALEALDAAPPEYIASLRSPLREETFASIDDEKTLDGLWRYLFKKQNLIERVIRARKLHHAHFYSQNLDWGHEQYLARLIGEKATVSRALERVFKRVSEVLYKRKKWFSWVQERQEEEEATREKEVERIKKEAKMFKRHMKQVDARLRRKKQEEDRKRQDAFLDQAYEERLRQVNAASDVDEYDEEWDPIEDSIEGEKEDIIAVMKRLLWLEDESDESPGLAAKADRVQPEHTGLGKGQKAVEPAPEKENQDPEAQTTPAPDQVVVAQSSDKTLSRSAKKHAKAKAKKQKAKAEAEKDQTTKQQGSDIPRIEVNETRSEMRQRLLAGDTYEPNPGLNVASTIETGEKLGKITGMPAEDVDRILDEVAQIKELLFCRLLISHATLLPAALRANSITEFLADPDIAMADLRDVCLKVERPALQALRDACADFARGEEEENEDDWEDEEEEDDEQTAYDRAIEKEKQRRAFAGNGGGFLRDGKHDVPERWRSEHELNLERMAQSRMAAENDGVGTMVDFGLIDDQGNFQNKKMRVTICGRSIWNYPSEGSMARGGWLQYSIIAKGSRFEDAVELCRNWEEF